MLMSLDPGRVSGWALWNDNQILEEPVATGIIKPHADLIWEEAIDVLCNSLKDLLLRSATLRVACEYPQYFQSFGGQTSASEGSLVKLCIAYGRINQIAVDHGCEFQGVEVNAWKGQMSKIAVEHRIKKRFPGCRYHTHEWDAVGIGLYMKGYF